MLGRRLAFNTHSGTSLPMVVWCAQACSQSTSSTLPSRCVTCKAILTPVEEDRTTHAQERWPRISTKRASGLRSGVERSSYPGSWRSPLTGRQGTTAEERGATGQASRAGSPAGFHSLMTRAMQVCASPLPWRPSRPRRPTSFPAAAAAATARLLAHAHATALRLTPPLFSLHTTATTG